MGAELNRLQDERMRIIKEMRDLNSSSAPLTDEQIAKWEELDERQDDLGKKIENEKKLDQLVDSLAEIEEAVERQPIRTEGGSTDYFASAEYKDAFEQYIRKDNVTASLGKGQTSKGGALVPTQLDTKIREILYLMNPLREFCDVIETTSEKDVPYTTNIGEAEWISEHAAYPDADDAFGRVLLKPEKVGRMLRISDELLEDSSFNISSYIAKSLGKSIAMAEEKAFLTGNGGGEPGGIIGSSGAASGGIVQIQTSVSRSLSGDDLIKIVYDLKRPYRRNAVWVINDKLTGSIRRLKGSDGHYLWQPSLIAGQPDTLLGYRIIETEYLPAPAANSLSAVFGDWSYYTICDRMNSTDLRRYNELFAKTGEIGFRGTRRVDGGPILGQAFRALKVKA